MAGPKRVLIVEDDRVIAAALKIRMEAAGFEAFTAFDAAGGDRAARTLKPDLLLLDVSLPGGNGLLLARNLRGQADLAEVPIIFLTASKEPGLREAGLECGASAFFEKPFAAADLLNAIWEILGDSAPHRAA